MANRGEAGWGMTINTVKSLRPGGEINEEIIHFGIELVPFISNSWL